MKAQLVSENIRFERGQDPKESMRLGRRISLILPTYVEPGYFQGDIPYEQVDEDTQYFIRALDESGVKWERNTSYSLRWLQSSKSIISWKNCQGNIKPAWWFWWRKRKIWSGRWKTC